MMMYINNYVIYTLSVCIWKLQTHCQ